MCASGFQPPEATSQGQWSGALCPAFGWVLCLHMWTSYSVGAFADCGPCGQVSEVCRVLSGRGQRIWVVRLWFVSLVSFELSSEFCATTENHSLTSGPVSLGVSVFTLDLALKLWDRRRVPCGSVIQQGLGLLVCECAKRFLIIRDLGCEVSQIGGTLFPLACGPK